MPPPFVGAVGRNLFRFHRSIPRGVPFRPRLGVFAGKTSAASARLAAFRTFSDLRLPFMPACPTPPLDNAVSASMELLNAQSWGAEQKKFGGKEGVGLGQR